MSRLEANISLLIITFFAAVQYIFLAGVPESVSHFAFLCVTNLVGFLITLSFFFGELFRLDKHQILQSILLSAELVVFNLFMLLGVRGISTTITAAVLSSYFVFIVIFTALFLKQRPSAGTIAGVLAVLAGLFLMTDADINGLMNVNVLYLVVADIAFALYVMTVGAYAANSNPSILAMGQMFFCFVFSLVLWGGDAAFFGANFTLPLDASFWGSVIYVSFFIRGLYGIIQIYAQRYVTPLNTSLIFSTEIIMTMVISPIMSRVFGTPPENITTLRIAGSIAIVLGLLMTEPVIFDAVKKMFHVGMNAKVIFVCALAYALIDFPVQSLRILPVHAGIKNFLPFSLGLFFGPGGVFGCCIGCVASFGILGLATEEILIECISITITGLGIWYGWHFASKEKEVHFRTVSHYAKYTFLVLVLSVVNLDIRVSFAYFVMGLLVSLPINILFGNILGIDPVLPDGSAIKNDAVFVIDAEAETLEAANETLELTGEEKGAKMKQVFEIQSCIEELSIRILNEIPDAVINVDVKYGYAVSVKLNYKGEKYNPFIIKQGENMLDIMSLRIIKHRALRASYSYRSGENFIHVII